MVLETHQNSVQDQKLSHLSTATVAAGPKCDVIVIGAGLGGLGACILQAQAGLRVVCIEPKRFPHAYVGESLDWSAPALLQKLGLSRDKLVQEQVATYKRKVKLQPLGEEAFIKYPSTWYRNKPLQIEVLTCHVTRRALGARRGKKRCSAWSKSSI